LSGTTTPTTIAAISASSAISPPLASSATEVARPGANASAHSGSAIAIAIHTASSTYSAQVANRRRTRTRTSAR
jgi:hypothetical protein